MKIVDQLNLIKAALDPLIEGELRGNVILCGDAGAIFSALQKGPDQPQAYPTWVAESDFNDNSDRTGLMRRTFRVVLNRGKGLPLNPADSLVKDAPGVPAMFSLFEQVRDALRALDFLPEENVGTMDRQHIPYGFDSGFWTHNQVVFDDCLAITFSVAAKI